VARELTKKFEELRRGTAEELLAHYRKGGSVKGEVCLVVRSGAERKRLREGGAEPEAGEEAS
jgi:16S rRNA (cytidine1402-2'-O)-methyltransferase